MRVRSRLLAAIGAVALAGGIATAGTLNATGAPVRHLQDGQILYEVQDATLGDLAAYTVNPDGSHARQVYDQPMEGPRWSPDGSQIASCGAPDPDTTTIFTVGTGATRFLPSVATNLVTPCYSWSSDGARLACESFNDDDPSRNGIFTVRVSDWGDARRLTLNDGGNDAPGDYSPNSKQLVFARSFADEDANPALFRVNSNGTGLRRLTPPGMAAASQGAWSPQGNQILFSGRTDPERRQSLWIMHADGSGLHELPVAGLPCGGRFDDPDSIGCADPTWSPTGHQIAFRINHADHTDLERANADGTNPRFIINLGFDPGEFIDWGTHPLAQGS